MPIGSQKKTTKTPSRIHPSIKKDKVQASDYLTYDTRFSCEECSHFDSITGTCTIGYQTQHHRKAEQIRQFLLAGSMAFCRFHEID